jgi:hypothetical protein
MWRGHSCPRAPRNTTQSTGEATPGRARLQSCRKASLKQKLSFRTGFSRRGTCFPRHLIETRRNSRPRLSAGRSSAACLTTSLGELFWNSFAGARPVTSIGPRITTGLSYFHPEIMRRGWAGPTLPPNPALEVAPPLSLRRWQRQGGEFELDRRIKFPALSQTARQ